MNNQGYAFWKEETKRGNYMKDVLWIIFAFLALLGVMIMERHVNELPDVVFSYSTKQCVSVTYIDGTAGDCSNLPKKYNFYWGR